MRIALKQLESSLSATKIVADLRPQAASCFPSILRTGTVLVRRREPGTAQDKRRDSRDAGRVRLSIAADRSAESLGGFVKSTVILGTLVITDDWSGYNGLRTDGYDHHPIAQCGDPEVSEEFMPIVHLVFSNLKTWLNGIHHGVSQKHLQAYLNEFTFRFNRRFYPFNAFRSLLGMAGSAIAPTAAGLYSGEWQHPTCCGYGTFVCPISARGSTTCNSVQLNESSSRSLRASVSSRSGSR